MTRTKYNKEKLKSLEIASEQAEKANKNHTAATAELKRTLKNLKEANALTFEQWKINKSQLKMTLN